MAKSWNEKLHGAKLAHVSAMAKPLWGLQAGDALFIATPVMVRDYMKKIRKGSSRSIEQMREDFAKAHKAKGTCPLTSSIFARTAAEAALAEMDAGKPVGKITPFWRLIDEKGPIARKLSCGAAFVTRMRRAEGIA
ncbi:MAG: hypothetical protein ACREQB_02625 [Candidatus Binataceae bacterium]